MEYRKRMKNEIFSPFQCFITQELTIAKYLNQLSPFFVVVSLSFFLGFTPTAEDAVVFLALQASGFIPCQSHQSTYRWFLHLDQGFTDQQLIRLKNNQVRFSNYCFWGV